MHKCIESIEAWNNILKRTANIAYYIIIIYTGIEAWSEPSFIL